MKLLVFLDKRIVFFATPKTATTSIEAAFGDQADIVFRKNPAIKHIRPRKFNRLFEPQVEKLAGGPLTKIAIIRDPLEWLGSWYRYRSRKELDGHANSTKDVTFDQFVEEYLKPTDRKPYADLGSQGAFLSLREGSVGVDRLFGYDQLEDAIRFMEESLNVKKRLDFKNASPVMPLSLAPSLQAEFETAYAQDIALYNSTQS